MAGEPETIVTVLDGWFGGAATTIVGALLGRAMYHAGQARKGKRRLFGRELLWELPVAIGMAIIGEAIAQYFHLEHPVSTGIVATLAYFGPKGTEALFLKWFAKNVDE